MVPLHLVLHVLGRPVLRGRHPPGPQSRGEHPATPGHGRCSPHRTERTCCWTTRDQLEFRRSSRGGGFCGQPPSVQVRRQKLSRRGCGRCRAERQVPVVRRAACGRRARAVHSGSRCGSTGIGPALHIFRRCSSLDRGCFSAHWVSRRVPASLASRRDPADAPQPARPFATSRAQSRALQLCLACCLIRVVSSVTWWKTLRRSARSLRIRRSAFMTVVWSRPPNCCPILGRESSVSSRHRYIAI